MVRVTINCDASHHPILNMGGYAFWVSSESGPIKQYGTFKKNPENSLRAEMWCLINALQVTRKRFKFLSFAYINIDNMCVVRAVREGKFARTGYEEEKKILTALLEGIEVEIRHVKGHDNKSKSARTYVNNWCDQHAKLYIKECTQNKNQNSTG